VFVFAWPYFRRSGYEATLVALFFAIVLWIVNAHRDRCRNGGPSELPRPKRNDRWLDVAFFYAVPLALIVKKRLG
jgi:hypothetical protein